MLVLEYCSLGPAHWEVAKVKHDENLKWPLIFNIALQAAQGIAFVHSKNVILDSIAVENLLVRPSTIVQLICYQSSLQLDSNKHAKLANFLAARSFTREDFDLMPDFSFRSDIYSFGT